MSLDAISSFSAALPGECRGVSRPSRWFRERLRRCVAVVHTMLWRGTARTHPGSGCPDRLPHSVENQPTRPSAYFVLCPSAVLVYSRKVRFPRLVLCAALARACFVTTTCQGKRGPRLKFMPMLPAPTLPVVLVVGGIAPPPAVAPEWPATAWRTSTAQGLGRLTFLRALQQLQKGANPSSQHKPETPSYLYSRLPLYCKPETLTRGVTSKSSSTAPPLYGQYRVGMINTISLHRPLIIIITQKTCTPKTQVQLLGSCQGM